MDPPFVKSGDPGKDRVSLFPEALRGPGAGLKMDCRTRLTVNLDRFEDNVRLAQSALPPGVGLLPVVKANAYGHGLGPVVRSLSRLAIPQIAVMGVGEAVDVRETGFSGSVILLGGASPEELSTCRTFRLIPVLHHEDQIRALERFSPDTPLTVHLKIDSGMGRLGFLPEEISGALDRLASLKQVSVTGLMTHFPMGDDPEDTAEALGIFRVAFERVRGHAALRGLEVVHMANSGALLNGLVNWRDAGPGTQPARPSFLARPGLLLYGFRGACSGPEAGAGIRPILKVEARLLSVRRLPKGHTVSYGRRHTLARDSRVGVIAMGYADGLPRGISGLGWGRISGCRTPFLGTICMDMVSVDLTDVPGDVAPGAWVSVLDPDDAGAMTVDHLAGWMDTIPYEILCGIGHRSERRYIGGASRNSSDPG